MLGLLAVVGLPALEEEDIFINPAATTVDGFRLIPGPGLRYEPIDLLLHPKAKLAAGYDSNPARSQQNPDADGYLFALAGLEARATIAEDWSLRVDTAVHTKLYQEFSSLDFTGGYADARARWNGAHAFANAGWSWRRDNEPVLERPVYAERDSETASAAFGQSGRTMRWVLQLGYLDVDYHDAPASYDANVGDFTTVDATASCQLLGAEDSYLGVSGTATRTHLDPVGLVSDYHAYLVQLRWRHALAGLTFAELRIGPIWRIHEEDSYGDPSNDDRENLGLAASVNLDWRFEADSWLELTPTMGLSDGVAEGINAGRYYGLAYNFRLRLRDRFFLTALGFLSHRIDSGRVPGQPIRESWNADGRLGLEYRMRDSFCLGLWAGGSHADSNVDEAFDQYTLSAGAVYAL